MKTRILSFLTIFFTLSVLALAQTQASHTFTTAVSFPATGGFDLRTPPIYTHTIVWKGSGTRTTCTVKLEYSILGTSTWADLIANQTCTSNGTATANSYVNFVRITVTALTGASNTLYVTYNGIPAAASIGTVDLAPNATIDLNKISGSVITDTNPIYVAPASGVSFGAGTQYATGDAKGTSTGTLGMVSDGTLIRSQVGDSSGHPFFNIWGIGGSAVGATNGLPVYPQTSSTWAATQSGAWTVTQSGGWTVTSNAGTNLNTSALALETGGNLATIAGKDFATQTTLAQIKTQTDKIPALGQALAAASVPVILPSATITTLTPPAAITGFATSSKQDSQITLLGGGLPSALGAHGGFVIEGVASGVAIPVSGAGGGTQYAAGAAKGTATGTIAMWSDGTYIQPAATATPFPVEVVAGGGTGGTSQADNSAFTATSTAANPVAGFYHATRDALTDGRVGALAVNSKRGLYVTLEDAASAPIGVTASPLFVKGNGTAGNADTGVITVQGIASGTTIPVTPAANSTVDVSRVSGTATSVNVGTPDNGTQRTVLSATAGVVTGNFTVVQGTATNLKAQSETYQGGAAVATGNALFVQPGTAATFSVQSNSANIATQTTAAAILAKQPALGTAGIASADVITIQGKASMTPVQVDLNTVLGATHSATNPVFTRSVTSTGVAPDDSAVGAALNSGETPIYVGGTFTTTPATLSSGQKAAFQFTAGQKLLTSSTIDTALPAGTNVIGHVITDTNSTTAVTQATGTNLHMVLDSGALSSSIPSGTNLIGKFGTDQTTHGTSDKVAADVYVAGAVNSLTNGVFVTPTTANAPFAVTGTVTAVTTITTPIKTGDGTGTANDGTHGIYVVPVTAGFPVTLASSANNPCLTDVQVTKPIAQATDTELIAVSGSTIIYVCGGLITSQTAEIINFTQGTGTVCATSEAALVGSTTQADGVSIGSTVTGATNGGFIIPSGGFRTNTAGRALCLTQSSTAKLAGYITYVQK